MVAVELDRRRGAEWLVLCCTPNRLHHDNEYTMLEYNFALYFGLSVQLYEMSDLR